MPRVPLKIFISYRQSDTGPQVSSLSDFLKEAFGRTAVFVDTATVQHGPRWPPQIRRSLEAAGVLLVVLGPNWFNKTNRRRLDERADWVRTEITRAIRRHIPIVTLLIGGAELPGRDLLPGLLFKLRDHLTIELSDKLWEHDISYLITKLVAIGCRRLPTRIVLMDSHTKIYERKRNRIPEEMNCHVIRRQLQALPAQAIDIEPVNRDWQGELGILARKPDLIIIHYSCLDDNGRTRRLREFLERILRDLENTEIIVYSRTKDARSKKSASEFDQHVKGLAPGFEDRVHGLVVFSPKSPPGARRQAQTFNDPDAANDLRALVRQVLAIDG